MVRGSRLADVIERRRLAASGDRRLPEGSSGRKRSRKTWTKLLPEADYKFTDEAIGEQPPGGTDGTFPHPLTKPGDKPTDFYNRWEGSPFSDRYLGELGAAAVDRMKLGQRPSIDFLGISFSALDHVGHQYGPRSHEIQDVLAQLDVTIGKLLDHLDRTVGKDRYVVALSADHGVAVIPEQARAEGKDAGRIVLDTVSKTATGRTGQGLGPWPLRRARGIHVSLPSARRDGPGHGHSGSPGKARIGAWRD